MPRKTVKRNGKKTKRVSFRLKSSRRKNVKRNTYKNKRSKNMKRMKGGRIINDVSYKFEKIEGKNILLIIDPQNDFSDENNEFQRVRGNLAVDGSTKDYRKIIKFINDNKDSLDEIHVSLDTHTDRHIGHPGFWSRVVENGNLLDCDNTDGLRILSISNDDPENTIYKGESVIKKEDVGDELYKILTGGEQIRYYKPKKYKDDTYGELCNYVKEYINFYYSENNKHGQFPWIWRTHCIEDSEGHKIAKELQDLLILPDVNNKVHYHIKGQNNLAEMYSIFSAEMPVKEDIMINLKDAVYTGNKKIGNFPITGVASYHLAKNSRNLDTKRNTKLMDHLLGFVRNDNGEIIKDNMNRIFVCGEAKTHCVKSSLIDLMEYASNRTEINKINENKENVKDKVNLNWKDIDGNPITVTGDRIVLLANMTSPIKGPDDDIVTIAGSVDGVFDFAVYDPSDSDSIPTVTK